MPADTGVKRALLSVYDKTGIVDFAQSLVGEFGIQLLSTGGTVRMLQDARIEVTLVEDITGWGEMLDGRVKTLHPAVHAAILANRDEADHLRQLEEEAIAPIDMVVVNLYPFEETIARPGCSFAEAIEMIDIGGPAMLRAAAKNHRHVFVVPDPGDYAAALEQLRKWDDADVRAAALCDGALKAFWTTCQYDARVAAWLDGADGRMGLHLMPRATLRYGENPHQAARLYAVHEWSGTGCDLTTAEADGGGEVAASYNNLVDADAALGLCAELGRLRNGGAAEESTADAGPRCACVMIKHTNACGVGVADDPVEAYRRAYLGDPNAAMGGILACGFPVDAAFAETVMHTLDRLGRDAGAGAFFVEVWLATAFEPAAIEVIRTARPWGKRVRLMACPGMLEADGGAGPALRAIAGGLLWQDADAAGVDEERWEVVTRRAPDARERADLRLACLTCKHTKSNAITLCRDGMLIGNGAGQMSRVMSCRLATWLAKENGHADALAGAVAASDAFFPFRDGPDILFDAGITAVIQPGGSKRDAETVAACDERGVALVVTGVRHFRH